MLWCLTLTGNLTESGKRRLVEFERSGNRIEYHRDRIELILHNVFMLHQSLIQYLKWILYRGTTDEYDTFDYGVAGEEIALYKVSVIAVD